MAEAARRQQTTEPSDIARTGSSSAKYGAGKHSIFFKR